MARRKGRLHAGKDRRESEPERKEKRELRILAKMRANKRATIAIALLLVMALALIAVAWPVLLPSRPGKSPYGLTNGEQQYYGGRTIQGPLLFAPTYNSCSQDYRPTYGLSCDQQKSIFGRLPAEPSDMSDLATLVYKGFVDGNGISDLGQVPDQYLVQPEFYPGWRGQTTIDGMLVPATQYWTPRGYGTYPWVRGYDVPQGSPEATGTPVQTIDILRVAFNVTHWQGIVLYPYFPTKAISVNGTTIFTQDPAQAAQVLQVSMQMGNDPYYDSLAQSMPDKFQTNVPSGPGQGSPSSAAAGVFLLLPPTKYRFNSCFPGTGGDSSVACQEVPWVQKLRLDIKLLHATPGRYVIALTTMDPNSWLNQEYYLRLGQTYVPSGAWYAPPLMQYIIEVGT